MNLKGQDIFAQEQSALKRGDKTSKCFMNVESRNYGLKKIPMAKEKMTHVPAE